jgi:aspartyl-tRNA(Asn)/glutamyl-tRNA(Gln) amidotransferase subunit A
MLPRTPDGSASAPLLQTAQAIAEGRVTVCKAVEASLDALDAEGRSLNCVVRLDRARALCTAATLDRDHARAAGSPVRGIPMAHKDMFERKGHVSRRGSARIAEPATRTAPLLERLDALGAIDLGTLHMTEFALDSTGANDHFGRCMNPLTPDRIVGGSSSGLAAAVSAGLIATGLGSDTGGSIRIPSAFCGVFGLKPTNGVLDMDGVMPLAPTLDCVGPIARSAADIAVMMSVLVDAGKFGLSGPDSWLESIQRPVGKLRVGLLGGYFSDLNAKPVSAALHEAAIRLVAQGCSVAEAHFPTMDVCIDDLVPVARAESARSHGGALSFQEPIGEWTAQRLRAGLEIADSDYLRGLENRPKWIAGFMDEAFGTFDILACATVPILAPKVSETHVDGASRNDVIAMIGRNTRVFNYLGLPALSVPIGSGPGIGLQLIGRPYSEPLLLSLAQQVFGHTS